MANRAALVRLKKEYASLQKDPAPGAIAQPLETNFLHAHFILSGEVFYDTPYEGGVYHGVLQFPQNYPFAPPSVLMRTPSGRFEPNKKICFSLSDFHPELWNPMWSIRTILTGLVSFMNSDEITTGGLDATASYRVQMAKKSLHHCIEHDKLAKDLFGTFLEERAKERLNLSTTSWPPPLPVKPKVEESSSSSSAKPSAPTSSAKTKSSITETAKSSSEPGKNTAKNRKKREKEKRQKLVKKFFATLVDQVPAFLDCVVEELTKRNVVVSNYKADHVCWRTETVEEYTALVSALSASTAKCTLLVESDIGGRPIATFSLAESIKITHHEIGVVEIPAPKDGRPYPTGLEHVEFVINDDDNHESLITPENNEFHRSKLDDFQKRHPDIDWNEKAKDKAINPDVSLKLELNDVFRLCSVKFHLVPLAKVIEYEKIHNVTCK